MINTRRCEVSRNSKWVKVARAFDIKVGERFIMFEETGESVGKGQVMRALEPAYKDDMGVIVIRCEVDK